MRSIAAVAPGFAVALLVVAASPSAAYAASYLDEAIQALQTQHVYVSPLAPAIDAGTKQALDKQTDGTGIGIVVLPASAKSEAGDIPSFLTDIAQGSGKSTVVVAFGNDLEASSRTIDPATVSKLANQAEHSHANTGEALVAFVGDVQHASAAPAAQGGGGGDFLLPGALIGVVLAGVGVIVWRRVRRGKAYDLMMPSWMESTLQDTRNLRDSAAFPDTTPVEIRELLTKIGTYQINDPALVDTIARAASDTGRLFRQLTENNVDRITQTEMTMACKLQLQKVDRILTIYTDIQAYPHDYEDAPALLKKGKTAVEQYDKGVCDNIREAKRGSLVDFNVNIELLTDAAQRHNPPDGPLDLGKRKM